MTSNRRRDPDLWDVIQHGVRQLRLYRSFEDYTPNAEVDDEPAATLAINKMPAPPAPVVARAPSARSRAAMRRRHLALGLRLRPRLSVEKGGDA
jgi:hypothetical protein